VSAKSKKTVEAHPDRQRPAVRTAFMVIHQADGGILVLTDKDTIALAVPEVDILVEATVADVEGLTRSLANTLERQALVEAVVAAITPQAEPTTAEKIASRLADHAKE
jgi:hypothetical protein